MNLYWRHPLKTQCGDKYEMRSYVEQKGYGHLLPKLLGVYDTSGDIDFDALPDRFALKCTHGCGFNVLCTGKSMLNLKDVCSKLDEWMATDISKIAGEVHYASMKPRIVCEEYLDDVPGERPVDYKLYCFDGKPRFTMVCLARCERNRPQLDCYDLQWRKLRYRKESMFAGRSVPEPAGFTEMVMAAETLAAPFPFVRVDFYSIRGRVVLGEMTFTPVACMFKSVHFSIQRELGALIKMPPRYPARRIGRRPRRGPRSSQGNLKGKYYESNHTNP